MAARWNALAAKGAQTQRLLWASTSTKNPKYRDVIYVEELIGADTVDTIPPATFDAFRDHGKLRNELDGRRQCRAQNHGKSRQSRNLDERRDGQARRGRRETLRGCVQAASGRHRKKRRGACVSVNRQTYTLPEKLANDVNASLQDWKKRGKVQRLWQKDASLWTGADEDTGLRAPAILA